MENKIKFLMDAHTKLAEVLALKERLRKERETNVINLAQDTKNSKDLEDLTQAISKYNEWCEQEISPHKALYDDLESIFQNTNSLFEKVSRYSEEFPELKIKNEKLVYHLYNDDDEFCGLFNSMDDLELRVKNIAGDTYISHKVTLSRTDDYEYDVYLKTKRYFRMYYVKVIAVEVK